jgi:hypothetical protein
LAEREGFEPSIRFKPYNALAGRPLRPLGHLSGEICRFFCCMSRVATGITSGRRGATPAFA